MTAAPSPRFRLETLWTAPEGGAPLAYVLRLANTGTVPVTGFRLSVSGPARLDPTVRVAGAEMTRRLSNYTELAAPAGYVLAPGATWEIATTGLSYPLRHWSDGATGAYVTLPDGTVIPVAAEPTRKAGHNGANLRGARRFPVPARVPAPHSIIPWPAEVRTLGARALSPGFDVDTEAGPAREAWAAFATLTRALFPAEALARPLAEGGERVTCLTDPALPPEGYALAFNDAGIGLSAATRTGFLYGLITLGQMLRGARAFPDRFTLPLSGTISDRPRMGWRGSHIDVARQFYTSEEIARLVAIMAWNKLNVLHWHLSDDEAWRVEIDAYPALTQIGAWRGHGLPIPPLLGSGAARTGGYYTKAAIRDLVALADSLAIRVVPEIDIPGHCFAMLAAIPDLRDPGETGEYTSVQGFPNNCLNPARPETYPILETILDEIIALFPARIVHVGADEVPLAAWSGSPLALERLRRIGGAALADRHAALTNTTGNHGGADAIEGSATARLQAEFLARVQAFLASRGCVTGGWEEAAHGDVIDKAQSYLVGWRDVAVSGKLASQGYDIVVSPGQAYYLDMSQAVDWSEPGAGWAGWSGPEETYAFDPVAGWTPAQMQRLMGVQACIWSEPMTDRAVFDRLVFPRLSAIAETGWTPAASKSWERFSATCGLMPILYGQWEA